eukprot:Hpha_TRINITY_DN15784_c1_g3::TRINITY_DN15784_c1_g3_i1::g.37806::m.37806
MSINASSGFQGLAEAAGINVITPSTPTSIPAVLDQKLFAIILEDVCGSSSYGSSLGGDTEEESESPSRETNVSHDFHMNTTKRVTWREEMRGLWQGSSLSDSEGSSRHTPVVVSSPTAAVTAPKRVPVEEQKTQRSYNDKPRNDQRRHLPPQDAERAGRTVHVMGLHVSTTEQELFFLARGLGRTVMRYSLSRGDLTRYRTLFAFIEFKTREEALYCVKDLQQKRVKDNVLQCSIARNPIYAGKGCNSVPL